MDKTKEMEARIRQGERFASLSRHVDFDYYGTWLERARDIYLKELKKKSNRSNHIALASAQAAYEAVDELITRFHFAITDAATAQKELTEIQNGTAKRAYTATGRHVG